MVVLSRLWKAASALELRCVNAYRKHLLKENDAFKQAFRKMSGGENDRTMHITPTRFQYTRFKDDMHFYISLGVIPLGLFILYVNIFIGHATLTEIPEGYIPRHWEYYKNPIGRFISKHFHDDPQIPYEKTIHHICELKERDEWRDKMKKVRELMIERDDYKAWFYVPSDQGRHFRMARKENDELDELRGFK